MNSGIILVGDDPKPINGTYHIFAHCTELDEGCQVQVSHFPSDADSWLTIAEVDVGLATERSAATIATLAGCQLQLRTNHFRRVVPSFLEATLSRFWNQ